MWYTQTAGKRLAENRRRQFQQSTDTDCLNTIYYNLLSVNQNYVRLWPVLKMLLLLSHGLASMQRGFSINNNLADVNLSASNLIESGLIKDHVNAIGGLENMTITEELIASVHAVRTRNQASLPEKQQTEKQSQKNKKRSCRRKK